MAWVTIASGIASMQYSVAIASLVIQPAISIAVWGHCKRCLHVSSQVQVQMMLDPLMVLLKESSALSLPLQQPQPFLQTILGQILQA